MKYVTGKLLLLTSCASKADLAGSALRGQQHGLYMLFFGMQCVAVYIFHLCMDPG